MRRGTAITLVLIAILAVAIVLWQNIRVPAPEPSTTNDGVSTQTDTPEEAVSATRTFTTGSVPDLAAAYDFAATIPTFWDAEAVTSIESLNLYDPAAPGDTNLDRSQIFIRHFVASDFLTLQTVTIRSRTEETVDGQAAVTYVIEKNAGVAPFPDQPAWRNVEHRVTDVRTTDDDVTTFLVIAKNPNLPDDTFEAFLRSLALRSPTPRVPAEEMPLDTLSPEEIVAYPIDPFASRITKKSFGQSITPATSPVQPERFSGYHAGVDLETTDEEQFTDVAVVAAAAGTVVLRQTVSGYGGVVMIEHVIGGETFTTLSGHVRLSSVTKELNESVERGERIAVLGTSGTETDGERKHLHFAVLKGSSRDLRGYVSSETELASWEDPLQWLERFTTE